MYICNALFLYDYSSFSLSILEYIDISNLSKEDAQKLILEREQHFLDTLKPEYNILKKTGSSLGYKHSEESLALISKIHKEKILSAEAKLREANLGTSNPMYGRTGDNCPFYGQTHSAESKVKISLTKSKKVFIYSFDSVSNEITLYESFNNYTEATLYFSCSRRTLSNYIDKNKLYKNQWILSTSLISKK